MNKNQGATIGAIVLAGLLLRPAGSSSPPQSEPPPGGANLLTNSGQMEAQGEGPWLASCKYWAPARQAETDSLPGRPAKPQEVHDTIDETNNEIDWHLHATAGSGELGCRGEGIKKWGFPEDTTAIKCQSDHCHRSRSRAQPPGAGI